MVCFLIFVQQRWKEKSEGKGELSATGDAAATAASAETVSNQLGGLRIAESSVQTGVPAATVDVGGGHGSKAIWKPKSYGTASGVTTAEAETAGKVAADCTAGVEAVVASPRKSGSASLSKLFSSNLLENFTVDNSTYSQAQIRATFYPKFENEKSDQEVCSCFRTFSSFGFLFKALILRMYNI